MSSGERDFELAASGADAATPSQDALSSSHGVSAFGEDSSRSHHSGDHSLEAPPTRRSREEVVGEAMRRPLPTFLVLLIGFLLCDAALRLVQGIELFSQDTISETDKQQLFEHLVVSTFYLLLFLQVLLRTLAARIWGTIVFLFHSVWLVIRHAFNNPEEWLALSDMGRLQVFVRLFFFTVVVVMLNRSPSKETLTT